MHYTFLVGDSLFFALFFFRKWFIIVVIYTADSVCISFGACELKHTSVLVGDWMPSSSFLGDTVDSSCFVFESVHYSFLVGSSAHSLNFDFLLVSNGPSFASRPFISKVKDLTSRAFASCAGDDDFKEQKFRCNIAI